MCWCCVVATIFAVVASVVVSVVTVAVAAVDVSAVAAVVVSVVTVAVAVAAVFRTLYRPNFRQFGATVYRTVFGCCPGYEQVDIEEACRRELIIHVASM